MKIAKIASRAKEEFYPIKLNIMKESYNEFGFNFQA